VTIIQRLFRKFFPYHKTVSIDGKFYYIEELGLDARGWLADNGDWYPFAFWKIRKGETTIANPDEVEAYRRFVR